MSGPKSSRYTLTAEQLRIIREAQEKIRKELEEIARKEREKKETIRKLADIRTKMERYLTTVRNREKCVRDRGILLSAFDEERFQLYYAETRKLDMLCKTTEGKELSSLIASKEKADQIFKELVNQTEDLIQLADDLQMKERIKQDAKISDGMKISFASVGAVEDIPDPEKEEVIAELEKLLTMDISLKQQKEVEEAIEAFNQIEDKNARSNYKSITIESLKKRCAAYVKFAEDNRDKYSALLDTYASLCQQLEEPAVVFPFTEEGMIALAEKVSDCKARIERDAEQRYISQSIDEVMREMGYEIIGQRHVQKKSGRSFKSKLLTYEDGTVVNVTESSNGQITMEIGGADDKDRVPDYNERVALRKNMESFCQDFKEIERRLAGKGVVVDSRITMIPPKEEYAQIINYKDYDLVDDYQIKLSKKKKTIHEKSKRLMREN